MASIKFLIRIAVVLGLPLLVALITYVKMKGAFFDPVNESNQTTTIIEIAPGKSFKEICKELENKGVLQHWWGLNLLARVKKEDTKINAGEYEIAPSMTPAQILAKLIRGDVLKRQVTIKEGALIPEIAQAIEQAGLMPATDFVRASESGELLARAGVNFQSFEGYLFPETYQFSRPVTAQAIIWKMLEEGEKHWPKENTTKADELGYSRHEILTLASLIEKESGNVEEQPLISSVFHNRLIQGMKLQSDPTVIYGLQNFNGNLVKEDLANPHPFNTYVHPGLPPGPICNPGATAINAALNPAKTTYLFFVADGNGSHVFSTTLQEHNEAVNKYQRNPPPATPPAPHSATPTAPNQPAN